MMNSDIPAHFFAIGAVIAALALLALVCVMRQNGRLKLIFDGNDMVGAVAHVVELTNDDVWVSLKGETWRAICAVPVALGQKVKVTAQQGLLLEVTPINRTKTGA